MKREFKNVEYKHIPLFKDVTTDILGLADQQEGSAVGEVLSGVIEMLLDVRKEAKASKDYATSDKIRDKLNSLGVAIKDTKEGTEWNLM